MVLVYLIEKKNDVLSIKDGNSATTSSLVKNFTNLLSPLAENTGKIFIHCKFYWDTGEHITF